MNEEDGYRLKISADFSKAKTKRGDVPAPINEPLLKEKDLGIFSKDVDAVMIGAVTKFLDHYIDNRGSRREALSSGIEFGSYLVNAKNGKVIWGARYVVRQDPDFSGFFRNVTTSISSSAASSIPATSSKRT